MAPSDETSTVSGFSFPSFEHFGIAGTRFLSHATRYECQLWILVLIALTGDLVSTYYGLQIGLVEQNHVGHVAIQSIGYWVLLLIKMAAIAAGLACRRALPKQYTGLVPLGLAIPWTVATVHNVALIVLVV